MVVRLQFGVVTVLLAMVASSSSIRVSGDHNHTFRALALRFPPSLSDGQQHEARSRGRIYALPTPFYNSQFNFFCGRIVWCLHKQFTWSSSLLTLKTILIANCDDVLCMNLFVWALGVYIHHDVIISTGGLSAHHNLASFLRCRRKFKGILQNGGFYLEVSSKTMDTFLVPFPFHSEIVHTVVNLLCACYLASLFSIA